MNFLFGLLLILNASLGWAQADGVLPSYCHYKIQQNDTLDKINRHFGFVQPFNLHFYSQTKKMNPQLKDFNKIYPGQTLNLPLAGIRIPSSEAIPNCETIDFHWLRLGQTKNNMRAPSSSILINRSSIHKTEVSTQLTSLYESIHSRNLQSTTVLVSDLQPRLSLQLKRNISKAWASILKGSYTRQSYLGTKSGSITMNKKAFSTTQFDFGFQYSWERFSSIQMTFGFGDFSYYRALSATEYDLIINKVARINTHFRQSLLGISKLDFSVIFGLGYSGNSQKDGTKFTGGLDHGIGLQADYVFNDSHQLSMNVFYQQGQYRSDIGGFEKRWLQLSLTYLLGF